MVNYLQQFIPNLSQHTAPLREIKKKGVDFYWDVNMQNCFDNIKALVATDVTLSYYDRSKPAVYKLIIPSKVLAQCCYKMVDQCIMGAKP